MADTDRDGGGIGNDGFTASTYDLALRVAELRAVATSVGDLASSLDDSGYDVGPCDLSSALSEFADELRSGLSGLSDKVDTIADNVREAVDGYDTVEEVAADQLLRSADEQTALAAAGDLRSQLGSLIAADEAIVYQDPTDEPGRPR